MAVDKIRTVRKRSHHLGRRGQWGASGGGGLQVALLWHLAQPVSLGAEADDEDELVPPVVYGYDCRGCEQHSVNIVFGTCDVSLRLYCTTARSWVEAFRRLLVFLLLRNIGEL